jgi:uncharacterized membrane protein
MSINRAILILGLIMMIGSAWMLVAFSPGSGEFVVSLISMASGAALVAIAITLVRRDLRRTQYKEDK